MLYSRRNASRSGPAFCQTGNCRLVVALEPLIFRPDAAVPTVPLKPFPDDLIVLVKTIRVIGRIVKFTLDRTQIVDKTSLIGVSSCEALQVASVRALVVQPGARQTPERLKYPVVDDDARVFRVIPLQFVSAHDGRAIKLSPALDDFPDCDSASDQNALIENQTGLCMDEVKELMKQLRAWGRNPYAFERRDNQA